MFRSPESIAARSGQNWQPRLIVVAAIVFAALVFNGLLNGGPKFQGKTGRAWLNELGSSNGDKGQAMNALIHLGPEVSVPLLNSALLAEPNPVYRTLWPKLPSKVKKHVANPATRIFQARYYAILTLKALGPSASDAIPGLVELLREPNPPFQCLVIGTLADVAGKDPLAASALRRISNDGNANVRQAARDALMKISATDHQQETERLIGLPPAGP